jgi:hypothetical protein
MKHKSIDLESAKTPEEKLDLIAYYLERIDRRDKWRMWGSTFHSLLTIAPMLFFLWSSWYIYANFDDIVGTIMRQSVQNAATTTGQNYDDLLLKVREAFGMGAPSTDE